MTNKMFCFQCEQTAGCKGCMGAAGVCGKKADTAKLQDKLTGALIGLVRTINGDISLMTQDIHEMIMKGLFITITNVNFDNDDIQKFIDQIHDKQNSISEGCATCTHRCGRTDDYDMNLIWNADEDVRSLKSLILFGIRGMAAYAYHAALLGYHNEDVYRFFYKALFAIGMDYGMEELLPITMEVGEVNLKCMALLD